VIVKENQMRYYDPEPVPDERDMDEYPEGSIPEDYPEGV